MEKKENFFERFFNLKEYGSSVRTEVLAGLTTFFAMCYIVVVNPNQMTGFTQGEGWAQMWNAVFVGGLIAAAVGTLLMAFVAKLPFAQAAGMGLNSFFFTSFMLPVFGGNISVMDAFGAGLAIIFLSGIIFLVLSVTGLREKIAKALPECLKKAIPAGIGLFIALIGFKNAFVVTDNMYTFVQFANVTEWTVFNEFGQLAGGAAPVLVFFIGLILTAVFAKFNVKGNIILAILCSTVLYYLFGCAPFVWAPMSIGTLFGDFAKYGVLNLNFQVAFDGVSLGSVFNVIMIMISFCLVDMFDTIGTLYGTAAEAGMLDENGDPIRVNKAMLCDSIGTVSGAMLGSSTITTYVESSAGVAQGGRTGLTSLVVGVCFLLCLFVSPIATMIPSVATAPALVWVGVLMLKNFADVDMKDVSSAVPAFVALIMMPLTYSIANGIGLGAITYVLIKLLTLDFKKKDIVVTIIAILFALRFIVGAV